MRVQYSRYAQASACAEYKHLLNSPYRSSLRSCMEEVEGKMKMKVLLVGGGSGGHINPALAIAGYLRKREPNTEILYVGAKGGMEERLVPKAGYTLETITISGFQRKLSFENLKRNAQTVKRMFSSSVEAKRIIERFAPDISIGTGGYVCGPVIRQAAKMGIPCVIHESNAYPGVTTKMLSKHVKSVLLAMQDAKKYFDASVNCVVTGNPVRPEIIDAKKAESRKLLGLDERPLVLSFGGSLGAQSINNACMHMLMESTKDKQFQHIHGYGQYAKDYPSVLERLGFSQAENPQIQLMEYIDMPVCLAAADVVICRSGAMTLSEIEAQGKASILIPSPNVAENHQYHNAMELVREHAAILIEDKDLSGEELWKAVTGIAGHPEKRADLEKNASRLNIADANARIYREIKRAVKTA